MSESGDLTRGEALLRLHDLIGQEVNFRLWVDVPASENMPPSSATVIQLHGTLTHPAGPETEGTLQHDDRREMHGYVYGVGEHGISLPPLPGTIREHADGPNFWLDFLLTEGLTLRIAWRENESDA